VVRSLSLLCHFLRRIFESLVPAIAFCFQGRQGGLLDEFFEPLVLLVHVISCNHVGVPVIHGSALTCEVRNLTV
jgi:hypothetical protein